MADYSATLQSPLSDLMRILREMEKHISEMVRLEELKRFAIIEHDLQPLADLSQEEEVLSASLSRLEDERLKIVRHLYPGRMQPSLQQMAAGAEEPEAGEIMALAEELGNAVFKLRGLIATNGELLTRGAELARATAQWLLGFMQMAPSYDRSGAIQDKSQVSVRAWSA